jgi:hypothetical protein
MDPLRIKSRNAGEVVGKGGGGRQESPRRLTLMGSSLVWHMRQILAGSTEWEKMVPRAISYNNSALTVSKNIIRQIII